MYKRDNRLILLDCIENHWWKLDIRPTQASVIEGFWIHKHMEVFIHSFFKCNNEDRIIMLKKLREISNLVSSLIVDPIEKIIGRIPPQKEA